MTDTTLNATIKTVASLVKKRKLPKFYAVRKGHKIGIFNNWPDCQNATRQFPNAEFKSFARLAEAEQFMGGSGGDGLGGIGSGAAVKSQKKRTLVRLKSLSCYFSIK
jgi:hypothetical protein